MPDREPPDGDRGFNNIAVAIGVVILLVVAWITIQKFEANQRMENCRIEGRRDCDPIEIPNR